MAKTFNQFKKKIDELYWPKAGDEAKFMAMHGPYAAADVGGPETHDDAVFKGTVVQKDHTKLAPPSEEVPGAESELNDLIKNIHSRETDELLRTVSHLNLSTDPKHREHRDVINKELMYRYKNHAMSEELIGGQKNLDVHPAGKPDGRLTAKDFAILRARKNKKKMNEDAGAVVHGYVPKSKQQEFRAHMTAGGHSDEIRSDAPAGAYSVSSNPKHGADKGYQQGRAAVQFNSPAAREHAKKFSGFTSATNEESQLDELYPRTLGNYILKARNSTEREAARLARAYHNNDVGAQKRADKKLEKREIGINRAVNSLVSKTKKTNEESQLDEAFDVYLHDEKGGKEGRRVNHSKFFQTREIIDHLKNGHKVTVTHTRGDHVNKVVLHPGDHVKEKTKNLDIHPGVTYQGPDGPFSGIEEGKLKNAFKKGMERYKDKSKSPIISAGIHAFQTGSAARAANKYKKDTGNIEKFDDYAIKRRKVREENEVDEGYVSVNGQRVGGYRTRSPLDRPDVKQALNTPRVPNKAVDDTINAINAKFTPEYMKKTADNAAAERKRQVDAEKKKRGITEADVRNAYAVGTAAAMKSTGDTPPLSKSTINKSHKIAKAIMNKEEVNFNTEEIELDDGNVIEIDIELAEAIADLFDSLDEEDQDALAEMLHSDIDSFLEVVDLLENDGE